MSQINLERLAELLADLRGPIVAYLEASDDLREEMVKEGETGGEIDPEFYYARDDAAVEVAERAIPLFKALSAEND